MSAVLSEAHATPYQALLELPQNQVGEIIAGRLYSQPRPAGKHALVASSLGFELGPPFSRGRGGPGGWWILDEPEIHFVRDTEVVVPDLAGWRRERMPEVPEDHRFLVAPDWVCEILSPSTAKKDRGLKLPLYARYGVAHVWLIDPLLRILEAFELRDGEWTLLGVRQDDETVSMAPFQAAAFRLSDLWG